MNKYYYDLHIHSCLSPCGDDDMTPGNICGMAALKGLQIVALTDHNTCENCPSFLKQAKRAGLIGIAGMELTTAEEIHMVCLFEQLSDAMSFSDEVKKYRMNFPNKVEVFGQQLIFDENDEPCGVDDNFLPAATSLSLEDACKLANSHGALVFPAHIDKVANGIVGILGVMPEQPAFSCVEYNDSEKKEQLETANPILIGKKILVNSDAHYLWDINEKENFIILDDEPYSSDYVRSKLFEYLRSMDTGISGDSK